MSGEKDTEKKTKSLDDLFKHISDCSAVLEQKIDAVQKVTERLSQRIETVNKTLSDNIQKLDTRQTIDHQKTKVWIEQVENNVTTNEETNSAAIVDLQTKITAHEKQISDQDREFRAIQQQLVAANKRSNYQAMRLKELEKATYRSQQHGRTWNLEIDGIPRNIGDEPAQLQEATLEILNAINVQCTADDIDTIHRLPSRKENAEKLTIVRFKTRKTVRSIHENKKKLKNIEQLNINVAGLTPQSKIYIRPNLCSYYSSLAYNCRQLKRSELIVAVRINDDGRVVIKTHGGDFVKISHESELVDMFPRFGEFNFNAIVQDE